ncbi:MAG TPA: Rrf2 family transcriptional regulator [Candidatus Bipolaricaulis anaerobius]|jgi:Rrf2 family protein|uniref:Conserved predicted transcriptional regulator n=1 Tax=Candidatus Bipolaricaulis anaerobius TaxID=2026885 RepID=A0A2X3K613_9BACT|nr:Rrf2 family transcriptional regulator [Candidatus Bipolaricaulis anaerobius]MBP7726403.1 Rrf2 family transcriptional regulator [Candidatus Bipolaricaulis sp.]MDD2912529.1 Rrf2 family transcriptional regulator [Candidatus Bipolaricaulis anaerobius]MDD3747849.1 Rrf2 family transcriptional regulator [Candidatus Bipolaricaulis anaerobius]SQD92493.1 Conserved predicted transcriptional regulator [Candidatus Bipolaricaulis anaerobius]HNR24757.1 Rrf2 family transcriptional regulator [Candidatus Bip
MRLSLASKYAILTLIRLAARGGGPATVRELAADGPVPEPYLAKLVPPLVRAGILASARGRGGGIALARPAEEISLAEIIRVTEGEASFRECPFEVDPCPGNPDCPLAQVWDPVRDEVVDFFERTTIGSLAARMRGQS